MEQREVTVIKARPKFDLDKNGFKVIKKRVAAYARVGTDSDEQINSYKNQLDEYTKKISSNPEWEFVGIFADEGISGTSANKRVAFNQMIRKAKAGGIDLILTKSVSRISGTSEEGRLEFQRMIRDAKAGKIDKIVTKSISRFARNIQTSINIARELKAIGVEIYFDNEHISTLDPSSEMLFTISAIMAQEESRHISDNVKWTFNKKKKEGVPMVSSNLLGYRRDPNNEKSLIIIPEEAKIVKEIFELYVNDVGTNEIARIMQSKGYLTGAGKTKWLQSTVQGILRNEKYKGDLLLQKSVTINYLEHKRVDNKGHAKKYYIENDHEPIVSREQWDLAQKIIAKRRDLCVGANKDVSKYNARHAMSARVICVHCGNGYTRRQWVNGGDGFRYLYQCSKYIHGEPGKRCEAKPISENVLMTASCEIINRICTDNGDVFKRIRDHINILLSKRDFTDTINAKMKERDDLERQIDFFLEEKMRSRDENERYYLDNKYHYCIKQVNELNTELNELEKKQMEADSIHDRLRQINKIFDIGEVTPKMLTIEIMDAFIYKIIAVSKREAVFVINKTNSLTYQDFIDKRKEIAFNEVMFKGIVNCQGTQRNDFLNYKVVAI